MSDVQLVFRFLATFFTKPFIIIVPAGIMIVILINSTLNRPIDSSPEGIDYLNKTEQWGKVSKALIEDANSLSTFDPQKTYYYQSSDYQTSSENDLSLKVDFYSESLNSSGSQNKDKLNFSKGLLQIFLNRYDSAFITLNKVSDKEIPYWNYTMGNLMWKLNGLYEAEEHFKKEIAIQGNIKNATRDLASLLYSQFKMEELEQLMLNEQTKDYVPLSVVRAYYYETGQISKYIKTSFDSFFIKIHWTGLLACIIALSAFMFILLKLNAFKKVAHQYLWPAFFAGMILSFLTTFYVDVFQGLVEDRFVNSFFTNYYVAAIGIGILKESLKILVFIILLKYTKAITEYYDYILYASFIALGFAFVENISYFQELNEGLESVSFRAITSYFFHIFMTSTFAYGLVLQKHNENYEKYKVILITAIPFVFHGLYYLWVLHGEIELSISIFGLSFGLFVCIIGWVLYCINTANQSSLFNDDHQIDAWKISNYFNYIIAIVFFIEYWLVSLQYESYVGNTFVASYFFYVMVFIYFTNKTLSRMHLNKGEWVNINYVLNHALNDDSDTFVGNPNLIVNQLVSLKPFSNNEFALEYLPNTGTVVKRCKIDYDYSWYLVKLDNPGYVDGYHTNYVLIKPKEESQIITSEENVLVGLYLLKEEYSIEKVSQFGKGLAFVHWANVIGKF